jgi:anti-sigma B factor antagonist
MRVPDRAASVGVMAAAVPVTVREGTDHSVVTPQGQLFFDTVAPLHDALLALGAGERPRVVLDLSGVEICDSSALNLMAQTHQVATRRGGWLRLVAPRPRVRRALQITNLTRLLAIYDSVEAAAGGTARAD